jgi:ABC-2 type transport system ATP-binding protein
MSMQAQRMDVLGRLPSCRQMTTDVAIEVDGLRKDYGDYRAVRGISFAVRRGEVFGLLGPNGAGKTTTVEILEGFRARTAGRVSVLGMDPGPRPVALRERIGIVLQSSGLYRHLTVREAVRHWAGYYRSPRDVEETIALSGLEAEAGRRTVALSGGQQRRLDFALALVGDPELVFLDEPTTGFDPAARRQAWDTVHSLQELGKTVLLTTHYLDEAQALADRVAIIKDGAILAEGAPAELGAATRRQRVSWRDSAGARHERETDDPTPLLYELTGAALARGERLHDLSVTRPSLEEVYLELTAEASG